MCPCHSLWFHLQLEGRTHFTFSEPQDRCWVYAHSWGKQDCCSLRNTAFLCKVSGSCLCYYAKSRKIMSDLVRYWITESKEVLHIAERQKMCWGIPVNSLSFYEYLVQVQELRGPSLLTHCPKVSHLSNSPEEGLVLLKNLPFFFFSCSTRIVLMIGIMYKLQCPA